MISDHFGICFSAFRRLSKNIFPFNLAMKSISHQMDFGFYKVQLEIFSHNNCGRRIEQLAGLLVNHGDDIWYLYPHSFFLKGI